MERLKERVELWMEKVRAENWTGEPVREAEERKIERMLGRCAKVFGKRGVEELEGGEKLLAVKWVYDRSVMDSRWWASRVGETSPGSLRKKLSRLGDPAQNPRWKKQWNALSQISA